ncbi:MAG TPA: HWE histidine kinase domain-containing protein [Reyranella sp.]|nr:HWE histidine kinase domain-containing protein [Reyranella sp.]
MNVLEMIARDATLDDVLGRICRLAESFAPGSMAGVTVLDRGGMTFEHCVMPSAPSFAAGIAAVEVGPPHAGTCAAAVFGGAPVSSSDVENDERFDPLWRKLNTDHDVRAIRSRPVCSADGRALGSFFVAYKDGVPDPWPEEIEAVGARLAGLALDRHRATERQKLIVGEMQHRLKNLFAAVLSIAAQTSQGGATTAEFLKAFEGRVLALANAHDLLTRDESADLAELTRRIVAPFAGDESVEITGQPFKVAPSAVVPFSLVLHELATNAAKYGALSNSAGRARVSWKSYRGENGERRFKFKWEETGGPRVAPPGRSGFGTLLMKQAFADVEGQSRLVHAPEGLRFRIDAPMSGRLGRLHEASKTS